MTSSGEIVFNLGFYESSTSVTPSEFLHLLEAFMDQHQVSCIGPLRIEVRQNLKDSTILSIQGETRAKTMSWGELDVANTMEDSQLESDLWGIENDTAFEDNNAQVSNTCLTIYHFYILTYFRCFAQIWI